MHGRGRRSRGIRGSSAAPAGLTSIAMTYRIRAAIGERRRSAPRRAAALLLAIGGMACNDAAAVDVVLRAPLSTAVACAQPYHGPGRRLVARVVVPDDAPADLGIGAYVVDRFSRWYQSARPEPLAPGAHDLEVDLDERLLCSQPVRATWDPTVAGEMETAGLFFWSASASRARIVVESLRLVDGDAARPAVAALADLAVDGADADGVLHAIAGRRWTLSLLPRPFPANAYDPDGFTLDAVVTAPDG